MTHNHALSLLSSARAPRAAQTILAVILALGPATVFAQTDAFSPPPAPVVIKPEPDPEMMRRVSSLEALVRSLMSRNPNLEFDSDYRDGGGELGPVEGIEPAKPAPLTPEQEHALESELARRYQLIGQINDHYLVMRDGEISHLSEKDYEKMVAFETAMAQKDILGGSSSGAATLPSVNGSSQGSALTLPTPSSRLSAAPGASPVAAASPSPIPATGKGVASAAGNAAPGGSPGPSSPDKSGAPAKKSAREILEERRAQRKAQAAQGSSPARSQEYRAGASDNRSPGYRAPVVSDTSRSSKYSGQDNL